MDLKIRKMTKDDFEALHNLLSDTQVMQFLEPPYTKENTEQFLLSAGLADNPLVYAVEKDGAFIGYIIYHDYDDNSLEIGWVLYPSFWGKGYASVLTQKLIEKSSASKKDLVIECLPEQDVTRHIAIKYGFKYEGRLEKLDVYRLKSKE